MQVKSRSPENPDRHSEELAAKAEETPEVRENLERKRPNEPPPKKKGVGKKAIAAIAIVAVLGIGTFGYFRVQNRRPKAEAIAELTVPVELQDLTVRIEASGKVQPIQSVNISPKTSGRLAELYVEQGDRVEAGEAIARMESQEIEAQLRQAEARLADAIAQLAERRAGARPEQIAQARSRLEQQQAALEEVRRGARPEAISRAEARVAQAEANLAEVLAGPRPEEIAQARARVDSARVQARLAQQRQQRNQYLAEEGAISQDDLDAAVTEWERAQASLREAEQNLELLETGSRSEDVAQARAAVAEARADLRELENGSRSEDIQQAEARVREARQALDELLAGTRDEQIAAAEARVSEAQAQVQFYEVQANDSLVRAPFAGQITQKYATEGAFVTPTTSASATSSATSTSIVALAWGLEVLAKVPEADISQIKAGQQVEIVADAYPDLTFYGQVKLIAPEAIEERDVTLFEVRAAIETGTDKLQSGMNVDVTFLGEELSDALVVPTVAIVTQKGETGVLVPNEKNEPVFQPVTIGPTIGDRIQILDGIQAGDRVFTELPEGQKLDEILKQGMED
ncbi:biotin/lipoyl-binding protein [Oxynema sp. CENA135]|uniref:efflux RND transporter periplasmic adaptor subunit n=1 Tax=Oxynema sp. CENA135 TaxID=984206 RepID=UPI00190D3920|nr:efflux RND transporter periplasmic adaptor subunit [Oxynema sp. CENA135]MBK4730414.1 biotin/lipoyl-binding protein [Oxynema sp. CENA135]